MYWYTKAAEQGDADAQFNLGECYRDGKGVEQSDEKAEYWLTLSRFEIKNGVLKKYNGKDENVVIPKIVTNIGDFAFYKCSSLTSVTIPNSVTVISNGAFYKCSNLTTITIPNSVTSIGISTFYGCNNLSIIAPEGSYAYEYASKLSEFVYFAVEDGALYEYCGDDENIVIPEGVRYIAGEFDEHCPTFMKTLTLPDSLEEIDAGFWDCNDLTEFIVSEGNDHFKAIDGNLYSKDGTVLIRYAMGKEDKEFVLPSTVIEIHAFAFSGCFNLKKVTIPASVVEFGECAFGEAFDSIYCEIVAPKGSYAIEYAKDNGIKYIEK